MVQSIGVLNTFLPDTKAESAKVNANFQAVKTAANAHFPATSGEHGVTGVFVGTSDTQTLSNKSIAGAGSGVAAIRYENSTTNATFTLPATTGTAVVHVDIQDYTVVGDIGTAGQFMAGHVLTADEETLIGPAIAIYNLSTNADISGNDNTLDNADAINATAGILGVAASGHLGENSKHLQADAVTGFSGTGDLDLSIAGWHKMLVSGGAVAVGTNAATQKMQYYTDANGYVVFDIAGVTGTSISYVVGAWHHIALTYDKTNSIAYGYIDGVCEVTIQATSNLAIQASPSVWVNSTAAGTLEVASYHDEIYIAERVLEPRDVWLLMASTIPEPAVLAGKEYAIVEKVQPEADTSYEVQSECQILSKYNAKIFLQAYQYGSTDKVKLIGMVL